MFEYENGLLVVDELIYDPGLHNNVVVRIGNNHYVVRTTNVTAGPIPSTAIRPYKKKPYVDWTRANQDFEFLMSGMIPRGGFKVPVGRAATKEEFESVCQELGLIGEDISEGFIDEVGAAYGEYRKEITSRQINVPMGEAIALERKLQAKGIQASNVSPGRVNIRTEWGGKREGAGRPSTGRKRQFVYVTDDEFDKIKELLEQLRSKN